jgi:hypothetical protein
MGYIKLDDNNIVIQKSYTFEPDFIEVSDDVECGMVLKNDEYVVPEVTFRFTAMEVLRQERDRLIARTDWWANSDLTMTQEQKDYRKALRDLPSTASPELDEHGQLTGVTWPEKPKEGE